MLALIYLLGGLVVGTCGFGAGLLCVSLASFLLPVQSAVVLTGLATSWLPFALLWTLRRHAVWTDSLPLLVGFVVGAPLGLLVMKVAQPGLLQGVLGVGLAAAIGVELGLGGRLPATRGTGLLAGGFGGILGVAASAGGPPAVVWIEAGRQERRRRVATLQVYMGFAALLQFASWGNAGYVDRATATAALGLAPVVGLGLWLGKQVFNRMDEAAFRKAVVAVLAVMAVKNLWAARVLFA